MLTLPSRGDSQEGTKADCTAKIWVTYQELLLPAASQGRDEGGDGAWPALASSFHRLFSFDLW